MADVKISQLILMDSPASLPITNAIIDSDQLIVNDVSSLITKRVTIHDILLLRNGNIDDTADGSKVTGNLEVTGDIIFGGSLEDQFGNTVTDLSTLITQEFLENLLGVDETGTIVSLRCIRDSAPTRSGYGCGVTVDGELTVDSDLYVGGVLYGNGSGLTDILFATKSDSADHARFAILSDFSNQAENAVRADSAYHSIWSEQTKQIQTVSTDSNDVFYPTFVRVTPGVDSVSTAVELQYNPFEGTLTSPYFVGDGRFLTNIIAESSRADELKALPATLDAAHHVMFRENASGYDSTNTDGSFLYNPVSNIIQGTTETDLFLWGGAEWSRKTYSKNASGLNYVTMKSSSTGLDSVSTDTGLTYDATTETLVASFFQGDGSGITNVDAVTATTATNVQITAVSDPSTYYIHMGSAPSGGDGVNVDTTLRYNPSTNTLSIASDTNAITWGADNDLSVYHDGSNAYIDNATGALNIRNTGGGDNVVILTGLPTADTGLAAGQLWNDGGFLRISSGS